MAAEGTAAAMAVPGLETTRLPHGWVLWYFDPRNKDWSLQNYKKVADISTPQQLWSVLAAIPSVAWEVGYFFFMRHGFRPKWDVPENERGGSWSKKVPTSDIHDIVIDLIVHCVAAKGNLMVSQPETLVGFSTSPKGDFNILKIWNTDSKQHANTLLNPGMPKFPITGDVVYTAHKTRHR
jgi:hypothetical protein